MSSVANWSYTATATLWRLVGRDDWTGATLYAAPVTLACDYSAKAESRTDARGQEFVTRQVVYTELAGVKPGDYLLIGTSAEPDPLVAGASEVRAVQRNADTFERLADDFELLT